MPCSSRNRFRKFAYAKRGKHYRKVYTTRTKKQQAAVLKVIARYDAKGIKWWKKGVRLKGR